MRKPFGELTRCSRSRRCKANIRCGGATVTFEPGARTAWHTHLLGQTLIVTQGRGWIQMWGETTQEMYPGDIVWIPAGVKHWHGATPDTAMTHIAPADAGADRIKRPNRQGTGI